MNPLNISHFTMILISMKTTFAIFTSLLAIPFFYSQVVFAQSISLNAPVSGTAYSSSVNFALNFTITEPSGTPQSISLEMTNNSSSTTYEYTLSSTALSQSLSIPAVSLGVPDGNYNLFLRYVRPVSAGGANVDSSTVTNVTLDTSTQSPTLTSPQAGSTSQFVTLTYSVPETPATSTVTVTFSDGGSNIGVLYMDTSLLTFSGQINLRGTSFPSEVIFSSGFPLVDATYTVTLAYQDLFLNPLSSASVSGISLIQPTPTPTATPLPTSTPTPTPTATSTPTPDPYKLSLLVVDNDSIPIGPSLISIGSIGTYFTDANGLFEMEFSSLYGSPNRGITVKTHKSGYSFPAKDTTFGAAETIVGEKLAGTSDGCTKRDLYRNQKRRSLAANSLLLKTNTTFTELFTRLDLINNSKLRARATSLSNKATAYFSRYQKAELRLPTEVLACKRPPSCKKNSYAASLAKILEISEKFSEVVTQISTILSDKRVALNKTAAKFKKGATAQLKIIAKKTKSFPRDKIACK